MKLFLPILLLSFLVFFSCEEEPLPVYPEEIIISCQADADAAKELIGNATYNINEPEAGFKGNIVITNPASTCNNPISDLSLFSNYRFWLGSIQIESDDIDDLSFLSDIEQIRDGLIIKNCSNLTSVELPNTAYIGNYFTLEDNANITSLHIGAELTDTYEAVELDSTYIVNNPNLAEWKAGAFPLDFKRSATITSNDKFTSWLAFEDLSLPSRSLELEMNGVVVDDDGVNTRVDSLVLPVSTLINVLTSGNDFSWLSKVKGRDRFDAEGIKIDSVSLFTITGDVLVEEVCDLKGLFNPSTMLEIFSTTIGGEITEQNLIDECP